MKVDDYINCDELIKEANDLYEIVYKKELHNADRNYISSMNNYINTYQTFRKKFIITYINDLREYILMGVDYPE